MPDALENCSYRRPIPSDPNGAVFCGLVSLATGLTDPEMCRAQRDACEACGRTLRQPELINPVVASLIYGAAARVIAAGGHAQCDLDTARKLLQCATGHLSVILGEMPDRCFPPEWPAADGKAAASTGQRPPGSRTLTWAVGLLTAPRRDSTIECTMQSLHCAGFRNIHIFAEPGSWIPPLAEDTRVIRHPRRLGNFVNFYSSLVWLLDRNPAADVFGMFQDDIEAAGGLKRWCDEQLWPLGAGLVSLFTPRFHAGPAAGWRLLSPGYWRVCGAQALVLRRDFLQRFLSDPQVVRSLQTRDQGDDAVMAGWAARQGLGIAYHTPSLIQHIGKVSSIYDDGPDERVFAHAVSSVDLIPAWQSPAGGKAAIGLVGWNTPTGLGYQNRDLVKHLGIARWLIPRHPDIAPLGVPKGDVRVEVLDDPPDNDELRRSLHGLDYVLFVERPCLDNLVRVAAHAGIGLACVPNWEWIHPELEWVPFVDLMVCPTQKTLLQMNDWKRRFGFGWEAVYVPWPIDDTRFRFRERHVCRRFLFVNGWGGGAGKRLDGSPTEYTRKGLELILDAARLARHLTFVVHSLTERTAKLPSNVQWQSPVADNVELYDEGDVCVQPSHYEGLGLQLLECQAAGMPLVTADAPPMNEYEPWRRIPVWRTEVVSIGGVPISSHVVRPEDLVNTLEPLVGADISEASRRAREYVVREHSWDAAVKTLRTAITTR